MVSPWTVLLLLHEVTKPWDIGVIDAENLFVQGDTELGCRITDRRFNEKFRIKSKKDDPGSFL